MKRKIFIGFKVPRKIIDTISMVRSTINKDDRFFNWSSGNNLHLTLLFLGSQDISTIDKISSASKKVFSNFNNFEITIDGTGTFFKKNGHQILWLGINNGKQNLEKVNYELKTALEKILKLNLDSKFTPHITIGRKKKKYFQNKIDVNNFMNSVYFPIVFQVNFFTLFESTMIDGKVYYKRIDTFNLT
tara:strand:+ start:468 stop:1031 length:564 start_codon:yes stop_codon:yes gene_type:complete